jgi:hypothetical protein
MKTMLVVLAMALFLVFAGCCGITPPNPYPDDNGGGPTEKGTMSVTIQGGGRVYSSPTRDIDCPGKCSAVLSDEFPFLNAVPNDGWIFLEWQGDDVGCFVENCPLTPKDLSKDIHVTAVFEQVQ